MLLPLMISYRPTEQLALYQKGNGHHGNQDDGQGRGLPDALEASARPVHFLPQSWWAA